MRRGRMNVREVEDRRVGGGGSMELNEGHVRKSG